MDVMAPHGNKRNAAREYVCTIPTVLDGIWAGLVKEQRIEQHRVGRLLTTKYTAALPLAVAHTNEFLQHVLLNELQVYMFFYKNDYDQFVVC